MDAKYFKFNTGSTLLNGLLSYWKLDETSGTNLNDEVGTNDLTLTNGSVNQTGIPNGNKCIKFNTASLSYAQFSSSPTAGKSEVTISMWVKKTGSSPSLSPLWHEIYDSSNNYWQFVITTSWYTRDSSTGTTGSRNNDLALPSLTNDEWTHLVFVYSVSGGYKRIYKNAGVTPQENTTSIDTLTSDRTTGQYLNIGYNSESAAYLDCYIDEVGVWDRALTYNEITELYNSGNGKTHPF